MGMDLGQICREEREEGWRLALLAAQDSVLEVWRPGILLHEVGDAIRSLSEKCPEEQPLC